MPDPYFIAVNVFNFIKKPEKIYVFPRFSLVGAVMLKLIKENTIQNTIIPKRTTSLILNNAGPPRALPFSSHRD